MKNHHKLYAKDAKGKLRCWEIHSEGNRIEMHYGVYGGQPIFDCEIIDFGLAGRTREEQIESRVRSRVKKKIDAGYIYDRKKAEKENRTNSLGFQKPMLATRHDKIKNMSFDRNYIQYKYDGHRCLIKNDGGKLIAYSRSGKEINSIGHILEELELNNTIPEGLTLDGELYIHEFSLQVIGSLVKKKQDRSKLLNFVCYDVFLNECYSFRNTFIEGLLLNELSHSRTASTVLIVGEFEIQPLLESSREKGFEGLIIRPIGFHYEAGKRSKGLIKVKAWFDKEYQVLGISKGVNGQAILKLEHNGKEFKATCCGTDIEKKYVAEHPNLYIGKFVTVQYAGLTDDLKPFHPTAIAWRDIENE